MQLPDCFVEIGCVTDCIGGRAYSEGCQHSENFMGCTVGQCRCQTVIGIELSTLIALEKERCLYALDGLKLFYCHDCY